MCMLKRGRNRSERERRSMIEKTGMRKGAIDARIGEETLK